MRFDQRLPTPQSTDYDDERGEVQSLQTVQSACTAASVYFGTTKFIFPSSSSSQEMTLRERGKLSVTID